MNLSINVLASGSRGNSLVVSTGYETVLIDAGLSARKLDRKLRQIGYDMENISALLLTHEHADHICGASTLADRWNIPVYGTAGTLSRLNLKKSGLCNHIHNDMTFSLGSLSVRSFPVPHDARDPVGFVVSAHGKSIGIVTDLGHFSRSHANILKQCNWLVLECNHDPAMLESGPYPPFLKTRIKGNNGHLSNEQASEAIRLSASSHLQGLILAHLSEKNNTRELAESAVLNTLYSLDSRLPRIETALQDYPIGPFTV